VKARIYLRGRLQVVILGPTDPEIQEPGALLLEDDKEIVDEVHRLTLNDSGFPAAPDAARQADFVFRAAADVRYRRYRQKEGGTNG
jgi:hypothetical protein